VLPKSLSAYTPSTMLPSCSGVAPVQLRQPLSYVNCSASLNSSLDVYRTSQPLWEDITMRTQLWQLLHACTTPVLISDRPPPTTSMTTTVSCCLLDLPQIDLGGPTKMFPPRSTAEV
jgi:hypothetical protein